MSMDIDKRNGEVCYNDENHTYWDENGNYISVTTLIGKYCQPFDKEFWSGYKALEKLLGKEDFKMEKKMLLETKKINLKYYIDMYNITENDFNREQQKVLDDWQKSNEEACERGTKIHAELENLFTSKKETDLKKFGIGGKFRVNTNKSLEDANLDLLDIENGVFPEYLVYRQSEDGILKIAGQIDLLVKEGNNIYIIDYKSNKKIDEKSYYNQQLKKYDMMKYPLNNLMDCNLLHYSMQLSTYAWMIQKLNPNFKIAGLKIIHYPHEGGVKEYEVNYLKNEVERMLKDYKKHIILDKRKNARKPIEF